MHKAMGLIRYTALTAAMAGVLLAAPAWALKVEPGQWETEFSFTMPYVAEPQTRTDSQCITDAEFDIEEMLNNEENPCEMTIVESSDSELRMEMTCPTPQGSMTGFWNVRSSGDSMQGEGGTTMSMAGQEFKTTMSMSARRTGPCQ